MSDGPPSEQRPIFSTIGRGRRSGEGRSAGLMLVVVLGLGAAVVAFGWEQASRVFIHTVRITFLPDEADAADAAIAARLEAARALAAPADADPPGTDAPPAPSPTSTAGATTTSRGGAPESEPRTTDSPHP